MADGNKAWVEYENAWYAVPQENMKALDSGDSGALPNEQLADLGLDPQKWDVEWELAGTETVDGAEVYHLTAKPDAQQIAGDVMKALEDPELYEKLGDPETAQQMEALKGQNAKQLKELQKALENVAVDLWIETESMYTAQGSDRGRHEHQGHGGRRGPRRHERRGRASRMADFDEPVEVKAPAKAKDFDTLMENLVGGMMGGGMSL